MTFSYGFGKYLAVGRANRRQLDTLLKFQENQKKISEES